MLKGNMVRERLGNSSLAGRVGLYPEPVLNFEAGMKKLIFVTSAPVLFEILYSMMWSANFKYGSYIEAYSSKSGRFLM